MIKSLTSFVALASVVAFSVTAVAEESAQHFSMASQNSARSVVHASRAVSHTVVGSSKIVAGVVAVPFKGVGVVGDASKAVGDYFWEKANGPEVLVVSDETFINGRRKVLRNADQSKNEVWLRG